MLSGINHFIYNITSQQFKDIFVNGYIVDCTFKFLKCLN